MDVKRFFVFCELEKCSNLIFKIDDIPLMLSQSITKIH